MCISPSVRYVNRLAMLKTNRFLSGAILGIVKYLCAKTQKINIFSRGKIIYARKTVPLSLNTYLTLEEK